jgi:hypothetical protein
LLKQEQLGKTFSMVAHAMSKRGINSLFEANSPSFQSGFDAPRITFEKGLLGCFDNVSASFHQAALAVEVIRYPEMLVSNSFLADQL